MSTVSSQNRDRGPEPSELSPVPMNQQPVEKFKEFLEIKGLKITGERLRIVEYVFEKHNHFEADQLLESMRQKGLRVSRPTVYRTLTLLVEAGLLRELNFGRRTAFEHNYGYPAHEHLYCESCGSVFEFVSEELNRVQDEICRSQGFLADHRKFIIFGTCSACRQKKSTTRRLDLI